jgi:hypothetical protein
MLMVTEMSSQSCGFMKACACIKQGRGNGRALAWPYLLWKILLPGDVCTLGDVGFAMINAVLQGDWKQILEYPDISQLARRASTGSL